MYNRAGTQYLIHVKTTSFCGQRRNRLWQEAERLGISERQLRDWMRERVVPFTKIGQTILFDPSKTDVALSKFERKEASA
jgi:hypothetical protein